jgi:hypothetical protein
MIRGRALLPVARELNRKSTEAWKRSTINRAYYAAFGEASTYARSNGYARGGGSPHTSMWDFIERVPDADTRRRAKRAAVRGHGRWLQEEREKADYRLESASAEAFLIKPSELRSASSKRWRR